MQYVEAHLTRHHLFHAPHRWFFALLLSPIHAAELHYEKRYRLQYVQAKKLFVFDLTLILFTITLFGATLFWHFYNPTIIDEIELTIAQTADNTDARIPSGAVVTETFSYRNNSAQTLTDTNLAIDLPPGFVVTDASPKNIFTDHTGTFTIGTVAPGASGTVTVTGLLYGTPDKEESIVGRLSYVPEGNTARETKPVRRLVTLRGSVLETSFGSPAVTSVSAWVLSKSAVPIEFSLHNTNPSTVDSRQSTLPPISVDLPNAPGTALKDIVVSTGTIKNGRWLLPSLASGETVRGTATLALSLPNSVTQLALQLTSHLTVNGHDIAQTPAMLALLVQSPDIVLTADWSDGTEPVTPGTTKTVRVTIKNNSNLIMRSVRAALDAQPTSAPKTLLPDDETTIDLLLPVPTDFKTATDVTLAPVVHITGHFDGSAVPFVDTVTLSPRPVRTALTLTAESRYYTDEGDQLGRGPLPPQMGKETKYWAIISLHNTTSAVSALTVSAVLPPHVTWTGRKSITLGKDVVYNNTTRTISWQVPLLKAHEDAGLYLELAFTPTAAQLGTNPLLLEKITATAHDEFVNENISLPAVNIDTSLPADALGRQKGTLVK